MSEQRTIEPQRKVVCAAVRHKDGRIVCGARHYDKLMHDVLQQLPDYMDWRTAEQGFVDQFGNFLTREDAALLVGKASGVLYSEDLY